MSPGPHSFVARMPNEPGALHKAAAVLKRHNGNIERIQYDTRIDPNTVFFELSADEHDLRNALDELDSMGYLRRTLPVPAYLKFDITLPHVPGALFDFLDMITGTGTNIAYLDYDETIPRGGPLRVAVVIDDGSRARQLLDGLKTRYPLEIIEHSSVNEDLDSTVFYVRFAQEVRSLIPGVDEDFLLGFLHESNHIAQELTRRGEDPRKVLRSILDSGRMLKQSVGAGCTEMYSHDVPGGLLHCIQFPCGGNSYLLDIGARLVIDTGFGSYRQHLMACIRELGWNMDDIDAVLITHGDTDHCGSAWSLGAEVYMSPQAYDIVSHCDRSHGSEAEGGLLETFYTRMIGLFSEADEPGETVLLKGGSGSLHGFDVRAELEIAGVSVTVLEGKGGHQEGQVFFLFPGSNMIFTGDSLINFSTLTEERKEYMTLAKVLMTSVNVDSSRAKRERDMLLGLIDSYQNESGSVLMVCPGHGGVSMLNDDGLVPWHQANALRP